MRYALILTVAFVLFGCDKNAKPEWGYEPTTASAPNPYNFPPNQK